MEAYDAAAQAASRLLTLSYSTSFGSASGLYHASVRADIFNIYGMVRVADEIVDTYRGKDSREQLDAYEQAVYDAIHKGFSTDLILHAFQLTARRFGIHRSLIEPFFASMRQDLNPPKQLTQSQYERYIYGSAEVVGLMCLRVFCDGDEKLYEQLRLGAQALGAAFQKVNFLRDLAADTWVLKRHYFPGVGTSFSEEEKRLIIEDIRGDFARARPAIKQLPHTARPAVTVATRYYAKLLNKLSNTPAHTIMTKRIRLYNAHKVFILAPSYLRAKVRG